MKTYLIPKYGIIVTVVPGGSQNAASISSELKNHLIGDEPTSFGLELEGAINALESLILAHAVAGIDVASPAYVESLRSSLEAISNYYS